MRRGGIYLVDFGRRYQSNIGKVSPAVILSSQSYLNIVAELRFPSVLVFPLTTQCTNNATNLLRVPVAPRGGLERSSEIIVNWSCSVDLANIDIERGALTYLSPSELSMLEEKFALYCGMDMEKSE